jgi:CheY-like chemotaxis protein/HD-like signal output (HDOD) protein
MTPKVIEIPPQAPGGTGPQVSRQAPARRPIPLLLADDNETTRSSLAYILGRAGFAVEVARDGLEAVALAQSGRFRAILMDVHMPGLDGLAAAAMIRRRPGLRDTPIVMVSSQASPETVRACLQVGATDFVLKQRFSPAVLIAKLEKALSSPVASANAGVIIGDAMAAGRAASTQDGAEGIEYEAAALTAEAWRQKAAFIGGPDPRSAAALEGVDLPLLLPSLVIEIGQLPSAGDAGRLVALIEQDAALALAALRASAGNGREVCDVPAAVQALGAGAMAGILRQSVTGAGADVDGPVGQWMRRGWRHALAVSRVAGELAQIVGLQPETARAAGLLHEVGRWLILASTLGPRAIACYELAANLPFPVALAEQLLLGLNSDRVGEQYCRHWGLAPLLAGTCVWSEMDRQQRDRLAAPEAALAAVVGAADQIAKAAGFASLKNDALWPVTLTLGDETGAELRVRGALEEAENIALFRLGPTLARRQPMSGLTVAFLSPAAGGLNPYQIALGAAGARLAQGRQLSDLAGRAAPDLLILDAVAQPGAEPRAALKRLAQSADFQSVPTLLLARRSDDCGPSAIGDDRRLSVLASPIRVGTFLRTARRLAEQ